MIKSERGQFDGIFLCLCRVSRDLEFQIKLQQVEVITRYIADERQRDRTLCILSNQELGSRRFGLSAQLAEQVELKRGVPRERQEIRLRLKILFLATCEIGAALDLREEARTRDLQLSVRGV